MSYPFALYLRQMALEREIRSKGFERVDRASNRAREADEAGGAPEAKRILKGIIDPMAQAIQTFVTAATAGQAGRRSTASQYFKLLAPPTVAFIIAKTVLDNMTQDKMEQQIANEVGRAIEDEARLRFYHKENPALFQVIQRDHIRRRVQGKHTKRVIENRLKKAGHEWQSWTEQECVHIGMQGIHIMIETTGLVERFKAEERKHGKRSTPITLHLTPTAEKLFADSKVQCALLAPGFLPCVVPPKPWRGPYRGGYWTVGTESDFEIDKRTCRLVKTSNVDYLEELRAVQMPEVYTAVNAIQNTAWKINRRVLNVLSELWDGRSEAAGLPSRDDYPMPTMPLITQGPSERNARRAWLKTPEGLAWKETPEADALTAWKKEVTKLHEVNHKMRSKRLQVHVVILTAKRFAEDAAIYFPHQLDFRSRVYSMPVCPSPQGPDYSKALLTFAHGEPITTPAAANWLAIHGANSFGIDKVSFHERVDWVRKHEALILATVDDPLGDRWWCEADSPFQFLAFCFEWADFKQRGMGFVSSLPIALDGTCNGLQHFSAMMRDERGGRAVNLLPADKPQDIYQTVADHVIAQLRASTDPLAAQWLEYGLDRKLTKRPVMILPYGGTLYACRKYIKDHLDRSIIDKEKANVFGPLAPPSVEWDKHVQPAVEFLAQAIWHAIGEVVESARLTMGWLRKLARLMAHAQLPIVWQTPMGFPVSQAYPEMTLRQVKLILGGGLIFNRKPAVETVKRKLAIETGLLDVEQQINGLSPNFVHSLDAAALMACVNACRKQGIKSFAMVHDSYGTTAAHTQALAETLRHAFVSLYQQHDVLAELRAAVAEALPDGTEIPEAPTSGSLNIDAVLESKFFFA